MYTGNASIKRRKKQKGIKRVFTNIVLAPGKMPRINGEKSDRIMRMGEIVALVFVAFLMLHMIVPEVFGIVPVVATGVVFAASLGLLLLGDYQDKLVEYELYGFRL